MSNDFDVITGPAAPPPRIKPSAPPAFDARRSADRDKLATLPPDPASAK